MHVRMAHYWTIILFHVMFGVFLDDSIVVMDNRVFESDPYQRVYQYIRQHTLESNLNGFSFIKGNVEGTPQDCLEIILK